MSNASALPRVALIGPGAIGLVVADALHRAGHEAQLCARTPFRTLRVESIDGESVFTPRVIDDPQEASAVDIVLVATKTYDVAGTEHWLVALRRDDTPVAVLQNGVEHVARFAPFVPRACIVPVVVDCPVTRVAPGHAQRKGRLRLTFAADDVARRIAALFSAPPAEVEVTDDFVTAAWRKLCRNAAGGVPAVLNAGEDVAREPRAAERIRAVVRETIEVGRAEGARLEDALVDQIVTAMAAAPAGHRNSLSADHAAGRPTEVDARNGAVVRLGRAHGIATPHNQRLCEELGR
ncbi:MAG: 2-dehydropantoate 2-reductase [Planctomycetota bacterium]